MVVGYNSRDQHPYRLSPPHVVIVYLFIVTCVCSFVQCRVRVSSGVVDDSRVMVGRQHKRILLTEKTKQAFHKSMC